MSWCSDQIEKTLITTGFIRGRLFTGHPVAGWRRERFAASHLFLEARRCARVKANLRLSLQPFQPLLPLQPGPITSLRFGEVRGK